MKVYNLRSNDVVYRRRTIPANGGFVDFPDLTFIPNRDLQLQTDKVLAFGALPAWWVAEQAMKKKPKPKPKQAAALPMPKKVEVTFKDEAGPVDESAESKVYKRKS